MDKLLESFFPIADTIAATFGEHCEVAIHDLTQPESSVVYVANGQVTGRTVGQSFDHLVRQVLLDKNFENDQLNNYLFTTATGKTIKSSSVLIRHDNKVIGMLCINYDITSMMQFSGMLSSFTMTNQQETKGTDEEPDILVDEHVSSIIDNLIQNIIGSEDVANLGRKRCVELVKFMDDKGIFLVKGSLDKVAALMGVSKPTIYSYLDEAKGKR